MILKGHSVSKVKGSGQVLKSPEAVSFLGGVNPADGKIAEQRSPIFGKSICGRVFVFPQGKGSTVGSYVLYQMKKGGTAPAAIINERAETIVACGAIMADIPMVDRVDTSLLLDGDEVAVDGASGEVVIEGVEVKHVITVFVMHDKRVLILKRSDKVGTFQGHWAGVSGFLERHDDTVEKRALRELEKETGLTESDINMLGEGVPVRARSGGVVWCVHPFMALLEEEREIKLDWEHTEYRWIAPYEISDYRMVPRLEKALESALGLLGLEARSC